MRKILLTLLAAGLLGMICSCSKSPPAAANSTPDPNVPSRAQKQQQAISKASEELRKKESGTQADEKAPPMTSPTGTP